MVEIDRLPAVVVDGAGARGIGPAHDAVAQVALEGGAHGVEPARAVGGVEGGRAELASRCRLRAGGVAELDLAAPVGQLLGDHAVPAGPAVMEAPGLAGGVGSAVAEGDQGREVLVPRPARAVLAVADAGGPSVTLKLELAGPAPRHVDHAVGRLRPRKDGGSEPVEVDGAGRRQKGLRAQDVGVGVEVQRGDVDEAVGPVGIGEGQAAFRVLLDVFEAGQEGGAILCAHDQAGLAGEGTTGLGADREVGVLVEHPARHVERGQGREQRVVIPFRKRCAPMYDLRKPVVRGGEDEALAAVGEPPGAGGHFTAPSVRPAMKCFCMRKNIRTGGRAATMLPALIR